MRPLAVLLAVPVLSGVLLSACSDPGQGAAVRTTAAAAGTGDGEVAVVSDGRLVLIGDNGARHALSGPADASQPAWSANGDWVAYLRTAVPPASAPYSDEPARLWVARSDGADAHPVSAAGLGVDSFAWDPAAGSTTLAFTGAYGDAAPFGVALATPTSASTTHLLSRTIVFGFAWAGSGKYLAVDASPATGATLEVVPIGGGAARTVYKSPGNNIDVASWWPDGGGIVFWLDTDGSASLAADGLPLMSLDLATGHATRLATTLVHTNWLAWSPDGQTLAIVAGGDRSIWDDGKHVELCKVVAGTCSAVARTSGEMTLEPAWEADGRLVLVRAPGSVANTFSSAPGIANPDPATPYSAQAVGEWYGAQHLVTTSATGGNARLLSAAGTGAHTPTITTNGVIYVRRDALWYLKIGPGGAGAGRPVELTARLGEPGADGTSYYGYVSWSQDYAWHA